MPQDPSLYKLLLDHIQIGIFQCDLQGRFEYVNAHGIKLLGIKKQKDINPKASPPFIPDAIQPHKKQWLHHIKAKEVFKFEFSLNDKSSRATYEIYAIPIQGKKEAVYGYIGSIHNISQYKELQAAVKFDALQSHTLIAESRIAYAERERNDRISYLNPAFTQLFGYTLEDLKNPNDWYTNAYPDKQYRNELKQRWNHYLKHFDEFSRITSLEAKIRCKNGSFKYVLVSPTKLEGGDERFSVSFYDITELKHAKESLEKTQERFALAIRGSGVGIWDWDIVSGEVFYSQEFKKELGYKDHEFPNTVDTFFSSLHPNDLSKVQNAFNRHLSTVDSPYNIKYRMKHKDGNYHWYRGVGEAVRNKEGQAYRMAGSHTNISQQMENHDKLKLAKLVFDHSGEAIITTNSRGKIEAVNTAFLKTTGFEYDEIINTSIKNLISEDNDDKVIRSIQAQLSGLGSWSGEAWCKHKTLGKIAINATINTIRNKKNNIQQYIGLFTDVTEEKHTQEIIWKQAHYDSLTELLNRNSFTKFIESAIHGKHPFALLFIDLDHFKQVNDTLGHSMGDELLKQAAHRIQHCVRASDIVSRFGGDEFTVVLSGILSETIIDRICSDMIRHLSSPFEINGEVIYISASIGITQSPQDSKKLEELYKFADQAMYEAKRAGRNRFSFFTQKLQDAAVQQREISSDLRQALNNNEFEVLYQPIINLSNNKIYKAEALLRWHHPQRGMVSPTDFIPIAEETGMINEIGDWVFKQAALQAKVWRKVYDENFQISINKSPVQLYNHIDIQHEGWTQFLKTINLSGDAIAVEITEGVLLDSTSIVQEKLVDFRKHGMSVSLDDFGTGYSALSYLKKFSIDFIKIDRSFVMNLEVDWYNRVLCETIISMSHKLGIKVIAEGIETETQMKTLIDAGCDYGQGYLISKPITSEALTSILKSL